MPNTLVKPAVFFQELADKLNALSKEHNIPNVDILNALAGMMGAPITYVQQKPENLAKEPPVRKRPTMTKEQIELVLGSKFRTMSYEQRQEHFPKMNNAVSELSLHLTDDRVYIFSGNRQAAIIFAQKLKKKLVLIDRVEVLQGQRIKDLIILETTLQKFNFLELRQYLLAYVRDAKIWHIYEW